MAMNIIEVFSSNVRFYRMKLKLSQEALAEKANLHRTYISDIERGQRNVSLENIGSITNFVGFPIPLVALSAHIE